MALLDTIRRLTGFGHSKVGNDEFSKNAEKLLFPEPDSLSKLTDLASARRYAQEVWLDFLGEQHSSRITGVYSLDQLMRVLSLVDIEFDDPKQLNALYILFTKHFPFFLANEQSAVNRKKWANFFSSSELFTRDPQGKPQNVNDPRCAFQLAPLMQNPQRLLKFMSLWQHEEQPWATLEVEGVKNYANKLRSFVGVTIDSTALKDLIKLFSKPSMAVIAEEFFFQSELLAPDEKKFQQNLALLETLLQASKKDKNPLHCLEPVKHLFTPKYLYALLPIIERIHPGNPKVVKDFLWHANKQAHQAHPKDATKVIPLRIMVEDLQEAVRSTRISPVQHATMEHPHIAKEMLRTRELAEHNKDLRKKNGLLYTLLFKVDEPGLHRDLENDIVKHTHLNIDLEQEVRKAYPRLSLVFGDWARQKFVTDLITNPRCDDLNYHLICAKVAADPKFSKFLQVKKQLSLFSFSSKDAALSVKTKIADASPFFASVVFKKSLTESFSDTEAFQKTKLMIQNDDIKDFIARQAFQGASLLEKVELIQQYQIGNAANPFLKLIDKKFFLAALQSHLNKLVEQYTPGRNQDSPEQKAILQQLNKFTDVLERATLQRKSAPSLYADDGVLNFRKILKGSFVHALLGKGIVNTRSHSWWLVLQYDSPSYTSSTNLQMRDLEDGAAPETPYRAPGSAARWASAQAPRTGSARKIDDIGGVPFAGYEDAIDSDDDESQENLFQIRGETGAAAAPVVAAPHVVAAVSSQSPRRSILVSPKQPPMTYRSGWHIDASPAKPVTNVEGTPRVRFAANVVSPLASLRSPRRVMVNVQRSPAAYRSGWHIDASPAKLASRSMAPDVSFTTAAVVAALVASSPRQVANVKHSPHSPDVRVDIANPANATRPTKLYDSTPLNIEALNTTNTEGGENLFGIQGNTAVEAENFFTLDADSTNNAALPVVTASDDDNNDPTDSDDCHDIVAAPIMSVYDDVVVARGDGIDVAPAPHDTAIDDDYSDVTDSDDENDIVAIDDDAADANGSGVDEARAASRSRSAITPATVPHYRPRRLFFDENTPVRVRATDSTQGEENLIRIQGDTGAAVTPTAGKKDSFFAMNVSGIDDHAAQPVMNTDYDNNPVDDDNDTTTFGSADNGVNLFALPAATGTISDADENLDDASDEETDDGENFFALR